MTEQEIAFRLLRSALDGQAPDLGTEPIETALWWSLFRLMQRNHLVALTAETVAMLGMPREVKIPWLAESAKAERWHRYQREVQEEIVGTMAKHGIDTLVLKGTHTAQHYPKPELREFGDLDLYFYDKHDEADRVAREVLRVEVSKDSHHHTKYNYRGVTVESHYDFLNIHYPPSNRRYEALLKEQVPSPTFEILFLLRHMACHFASGRITLRDLADWQLTCRALKDKADWQLVEKTVADYGMTEFAAALNDIEHYPHIKRDIVYGTVEDLADDGLARLGWKLRRWRALAWKRRMVFNDSKSALFIASLTSHAEKPQSILHKM